VRILTKTWLWPVVAASGFGMMALSYATLPRPDPQAPWANGFIAVGPEPSGAGNLPGRVIPTRLRLLAGGESTEAILTALGRAAPGGAMALEAQLRP
jgi:hypothetical protein